MARQPELVTGRQVLQSLEEIDISLVEEKVNPYESPGAVPLKRSSIADWQSITSFIAIALICLAVVIPGAGIAVELIRLIAG